VRFLIFLSLVTAILGFAAFYLGSRFIAASHWAAIHREIVWLSFALFVALQFLGPYLYRVFPDHVNRLLIVHWVTYTALGIFTCLFLYSLAADLVVAIWNSLIGPRLAGDVSFIVVLAMVLVTVVIGFVQAVAGPRTYEVSIRLADLPEAFDGFRIVQITDLHLGPTMGRRFMQKVVNIANSLEPDLVALTGDFVDGTVASLAHAVDPITGIRARHGLLFVPGNHEYYWGAAGWIEQFRKLGAQVLLNEHVLVSRGGSSLVIAGVTDYSAGAMLPGHASDPEESIRGAPAGAVKILLAHHPNSCSQAASAGFDLQISGHTHGGQFFPFSVLVRLTHRYYKGLHRHGKLWVYVSRGTGYWGPPLRFGVPAEITQLTLRRSAPPLRLS
jgi:predicted MPP superfamily phosphohydrolase